MFLTAKCVLPMPLDTARAALDRALADGGLVLESERAFENGMKYLMRVRASRGPVVSKRVRVGVLPSREVGNTIVVPLRWEATGPAGRLFPALDANVELAHADQDSTQLTLIGCYDPTFRLHRRDDRPRTAFGRRTTDRRDTRGRHRSKDSSHDGVMAATRRIGRERSPGKGSAGQLLTAAVQRPRRHRTRCATRGRERLRPRQQGSCRHKPPRQQ